jgi:aldose 1-epimerase
MTPYPVLDPRRFEGEADGQATRLFTLQNGRGMSVSFTNYGARIQQIIVPDRRGEMDDVVLGYDSIDAVLAGQPSMGAFVGRYANRICGSRFTLDGMEYRLEANYHGHCLHGGPRGSRFRVFDVTQHDAATAELRIDYLAAVDSFPGNVRSRVTYQVTDENELRIEYEAVTDSPTVVSMTTHPFFNLAGHAAISTESLARHELTINAASFTPFGPDQSISGEIAGVQGTPFDFRQPRTIGERVEEAARDHEPHQGYDHNFVLDKPAGELGVSARVREPHSGRTLEVFSTEPGLFVFGGHILTGKPPKDVGKGGQPYPYRSSLCLEPSRFPDSPNHPNFPSAVLRPGERYTGTTIYRFGVD